MNKFKIQGKPSPFKIKRAYCRLRKELFQVEDLTKLGLEFKDINARFMTEAFVTVLPPENFYRIWRDWKKGEGLYPLLKREVPFRIWPRTELRRAFLTICKALGI